MISERMFRINKDGEPGRYCYCRHPELIENYDKAISDMTQVWEVHHHKEELYSQKELKERGEYYDVSPEELIFLTSTEHHKIDSACRRIGESMKGKNSKKVLCVETGEVFESTVEAQRKTSVSHQNISYACKGKLKTAGGFHWQYA